MQKTFKKHKNVKMEEKKFQKIETNKKRKNEKK